MASNGIERSNYLEEFLVASARAIAKRNERWSSDEIKEWRAFFNNLEKEPLSEEQAKAVVDFENRNLLIAAAGSG